MKYAEMLEKIENLVGQDIVLEGTLVREFKADGRWYLMPDAEYQAEKQESYVELFWRVYPEEKILGISDFHEKEAAIFQNHDYSKHAEASVLAARKYWTLYSLFGDSSHLEMLRAWGLWEKLLAFYTEHQRSGTKQVFHVEHSLGNAKYYHHIGWEYSKKSTPLPIAFVSGRLEWNPDNPKSVSLMDCHKVTLKFPQYEYHVLDKNIDLSTIPLAETKLHSVADYLNNPQNFMSENIYVSGWITIAKRAYFLVPHLLYTFAKDIPAYGIRLQRNSQLDEMFGQVFSVVFDHKNKIMAEACIVGKIIFESGEPTLAVNRMTMQQRLNTYNQILIDIGVS